MFRRAYGLGALALALMVLTAGAGFPMANMHQITIKAADYDPPQVRGHVGDIIEWENKDIVAHTATAMDKAWDVSMTPGQSVRIVMKNSGTFSYICRYHPNMKGEIVIDP